MAALDPLRDEVVLTQLRAERAESELVAVQVDRDVTKGILDGRNAEIARLRALLARQQSQIATLTERVRAAEAAARQVTLDTVVRAIGGAIEAGDAALEDRTIVAARAEIKATLQASGGAAGLVLGVPGTIDSRALSTVSFDMLRLPPDSAGQERMAALAAIVAAVQELQRALDGQTDADAATTAAVAALAADPPGSLEAAAPALDPLAAALRKLAARRPELEPATADVERRRATLAAQPRPAAARELTSALEQLARELGQQLS